MKIFAFKVFKSCPTSLTDSRHCVALCENIRTIQVKIGTGEMSSQEFNSQNNIRMTSQKTARSRRLRFNVKLAGRAGFYYSAERSERSTKLLGLIIIRDKRRPGRNVKQRAINIMSWANFPGMAALFNFLPTKTTFKRRSGAIYCFESLRVR